MSTYFLFQMPAWTEKDLIDSTTRSTKFTLQAASDPHLQLSHWKYILAWDHETFAAWDGPQSN